MFMNVLMYSVHFSRYICSRVMGVCISSLHTFPCVQLSIDHILSPFVIFLPLFLMLARVVVFLAKMRCLDDRKEGQETQEELQKRNLREELEERERRHFSSKDKAYIGK